MSVYKGLALFWMFDALLMVVGGRDSAALVFAVFALTMAVMYAAEQSKR